MIQQIDNVPDNMVAFRSSGEVTKDDFDTVFPRVEELVDRTGKLNYLLELDNSPADFSAGAWLQDALLGVKNITKWNRAAIVTDSRQVRDFTEAFSKVMPGEFRGFPKSEFDHAVDWVSEKTI
ncbi:STAS/SEC14 domain-containing protein [Flavobacterium sp. MAH-1]|uniref:STAS/SEC14 domain-containing protein n=1 Tax=Flavobacterium agri TaxID=2743471 RepID=A0A7Y8Y3A9_9FLAO|nr:STAS/SEC14 domain-containing protein [Flavobacterium agri]NUY81795.1 STAS/SEC14 domain-containing protein [Flavobacterium agri]NYA71819.1 STAS/SEC14 domain-containing protein [Flavobacterium agri]